MPQFRYKALSRKGDLQEGILFAGSHPEAIQKIQISGDLPISAEEVKESLTSSGRFSLPVLSRRKVSREDVRIFTRELSTLMGAGLPLDQCLNTIAQFQLSQAVLDLVTNISSGRTKREEPVRSYV